MRITLMGYESADSLNSNINHLAVEMQSEGVLQKVICISSRKDVGINRKLISSASLPQLGLQLFMALSWQHVSRRIPERYYNELLFDLTGARKVPGDTDILLTLDSGLVRSVRRAKNLGAKTVVFHRTLHPTEIERILEQECKRYGVREESTFMHRGWNVNRLTTLEEGDLIIVPSELAKTSCADEGIHEEKIKVVTPTTVDTSHYRPIPRRSHEKPFVCLFIGHKSLIKGVPYLLDAWRRLDVDDSVLLICGIQDRRITDIYRDTSNVKFLGAVKNPLEYYSIASVFVLPSLAESFGRVVLEAMACGLPVIITEGVGAKEIIRNGMEGFVVPVRDSGAIAQKIQFLRDHPDTAEQMGLNARAKAEHTCRMSMGQQTMQILRQAWTEKHG